MRVRKAFREDIARLSVRGMCDGFQSGGIGFDCAILEEKLND
jgi:hypothetical protein